MKYVFSEHAREDYLFWQKTDKKILRRINSLIKVLDFNIKSTSHCARIDG